MVGREGWAHAGRPQNVCDAAWRGLGKSIDATVLEGLDLDLAQLAEIDENLARADLSPAERAMHTDKRRLRRSELARRPYVVALIAGAKQA